LLSGKYHANLGLKTGKSVKKRGFFNIFRMEMGTSLANFGDFGEIPAPWRRPFWHFPKPILPPFSLLFWQPGGLPHPPPGPQEPPPGLTIGVAAWLPSCWHLNKSSLDNPSGPVAARFDHRLTLCAEAVTANNHHKMIDFRYSGRVRPEKETLL